MENKRLTFDLIQEQDKQFEVMVEKIVKDSVVEVYEKFRPTKISETISEISANFADIRMGKYNIGELFTPYVYLIIIKNFTSLDVPEKFDDQINFLTVLVNNNYFNDLIEVLPYDQVQLVFEKMEEETKRINETMDEAEKVYSELQNKKELLGEED
jgi:hypothetical protein